MTAAPDIVVVMSDEHSPHFSSVYGHPIVRTPNMARLAAQGATFDAAYCASPICVPSRMAFMSGRMPTRTEAWDNGSPLRSDIPTLAHVLRGQGYETVLIGKMHFIGADQLHGFETRLVDDSRVCGNWIETTDWQDLARPRPRARNRVTNAGPGHTAHIEQDEEVLAACLQFLAEREVRGGNVRPLFLCVSFNAPHFPLRAPRYFDSYWPDNVDAPVIAPKELEMQHPFHKRLRSYFDIDDLPREQSLKARAAFYALVTWFDDLLGDVIDAVDRQLLPRDGVAPMLVYVSDHGDMAGEHGLWWKCCFFEESVRVPLIIRWPGRVAPGARIADPVTLIDLSITFADVAGANDDPVMGQFARQADGTSMLNLLAGAREPDRIALSEYCAHAAGRPIRMIRQGRWKYVHYHGEPEELYDLVADPREKTNLADDPALVARKAVLRARVLAGWDAEAIDRRVREHQAERRLIAMAERRGTFE